MNVATFRELLVCLQEIFQNIRDHSGTNIGSVFAQYFPNDGKLSISVSDIGSGIPEKVRNFLGADPISYADSTALVKACQENFTTSSHPGNAGKGLADLTLIITRHYNGKVIIISDYGYVQYLGRKGKLWVSDRNWLYPGCLIDIEININDIQEAVESVNEYEW
ncbi:MAG: ATP-binding protein [Alphaproteobacteria bacterium]|nr:ATP-binding protein [Alphaproteobacteria bacterium]